MTATYMLLLCLIVILAVCLFLIWMINAEWLDADEPRYLTANARQMARDIAVLRKQASGCTGNCNQDRKCVCLP